MQVKTPRLTDTLSVDEAAAYLGVHRDTITRWSDSGALRHSLTPGGRRRYTKADLDAVLRPAKQSA